MSGVRVVLFFLSFYVLNIVDAVPYTEEHTPEASTEEYIEWKRLILDQYRYYDFEHYIDRMSFFTFPNTPVRFNDENMVLEYYLQGDHGAMEFRDLPNHVKWFRFVTTIAQHPNALRWAVRQTTEDFNHLSPELILYFVNIFRPFTYQMPNSIKNFYNKALARLKSRNYMLPPLTKEEMAILTQIDPRRHIALANLPEEDEGVEVEEFEEVEDALVESE